MECPKVQNKVWTAKGLRDQRCRLSPSVALQLFDIQDKLGYEQPSKAIDWLIAQAKPAIDNLPLPPLSASLQDPTFLQNLTTSSSSSICYHRNGQDSNISRSNGCHNDVFSLEQVLSRRELRDGARKELEACSKSSIMIQSMAGFLLDDDTQDNVGYPYVDHQNGYSA